MTHQLQLRQRHLSSPEARKWLNQLISAVIYVLHFPAWSKCTAAYPSLRRHKQDRDHTIHSEEKKTRLCVCAYVHTSRILYVREELNEFRLKREVYSMFLLTLCLHELVRTAIGRNLSRIVLLTLFTDVHFVKPLMQINSICRTTEKANQGPWSPNIPSSIQKPYVYQVYRSPV